MTPTKIVLAGAAMVSLLIMFAFQRTPAPLVLPTEATIKAKNIQTWAILQPPFDTPSWVPDEVTKKKALMRAYELNGNSMVGEHMIDVSKEDLTEHVTADQPVHAATEVAGPNERNTLDAQAGDKPDWEGRRRFMNRTFRATRHQLAHHNEDKPKDVCTRHGMHRVQYLKTWRCRK